jgi:GT2 family glycosyltransferase
VKVAPMMRAGQDSPIISVIIVNYNGRRLLESCLKSLERQTLPRDCYEIILVDNASTDGSVEFVRREHQAVRIEPLSRNLGFAGGNNHGFRQARGRFFALLNTDAEAESPWLARMLSAIERSPSIGGVAAKICFRHDPMRINSAGLVLFRDGRGGDRGFGEPDFGQFETPMEVFGACGAGALLRREMIEELGGFDERLFMYYEDLDLAWRARLRGWKFVYEPQAVVLHDHCGTSGEGSPFLCFQVERNRVLVNLKNGNPRLAALAALGFVGRLLRAGRRVLRGETTRAHGWAFLRAAASISLNVPGVLIERLRVRSQRRTAPDSRIAQMMSVPPARARAA